MTISRWYRYLVCLLLALVLTTGCDRLLAQRSNATPVIAPPLVINGDLLGQDLVPLAQPGPWPHITELIGYGDLLWFANSVAFENHNSADIYSYDPATGETRYERHLFSQSVGQPVVADGLLYWPFEDPRFSADRGEYMVTNGKDWQWRILPEGEAFHLHTIATDGTALFAGTGAWAGRLQRSPDSGKTWEVVYEYPTPTRQVSRITQLATMNERLYVGVTARHETDPKLFRWSQDTLQPVAGWPQGKRVKDLTPYGGWLYGINTNPDDTITVWRAQADQSERVTGLDGYLVQAFAAGEDALWAVSSHQGGGVLWRSPDGVVWAAVHEFTAARPLDVAVYGGQVYVGAEGEDGQGVLLGPTAPVATGEPLPISPLIQRTNALSAPQLKQRLAALNEVMGDRTSYSNSNSQGVFSEILKPLALTDMPEVGEALSQKLNRAPPQATATLFGGNVSAPATDVMQWYLLWAIGLNGHGQVPVDLLITPWTIPSNSMEKYWQPSPAAAWTMAQLGQADAATISALIERLSFEDDPLWLKGDFVGALTALTGERFGYDAAAWQTWWSQQAYLWNSHKKLSFTTDGVCLDA
jgi:hypothetical protein